MPARLTRPVTTTLVEDAVIEDAVLDEDLVAVIADADGGGGRPGRRC
jgi:hypothetical protein